MRPHRLEKQIGHQSIDNSAYPQCHDVHGPIFVQIVQVQHLFPRRDGATAVGQLLRRSTVKDLSMHRERSQIRDGVLDGRQMIQSLQNVIDI